jgi:magnesium transporter
VIGDISIITYSQTDAVIKECATVDEILQHKIDKGISWININGLNNKEAISRIAEIFCIHPLTVEDIYSTEQRPKVEDFDDYLFFSFKSIQREKNFHQKSESERSTDEFLFDHISILITQNVLVTFQEMPGDYFDGIRKRIMNNAGQIRKEGTDYLFYAILDAVVDAYFLVLDHIGDDIEEYEERALDTSSEAFIHYIQQTKKYLLQINRAILPLRENLSIVSRKELPLFKPALKPFLQDLRENVLETVETLETYRELLTGVMEVNLSTLSNQMNKVMKVLTIISTIFIPLTFIVGVYGMNFVHMPEISIPWAYPVVWAAMLLIAIGMLIFFKRRKWL